MYFLLFHTTHDAIRTEKKLKAEKIEFELVPVPRNLSSDCGICVKLSNNINDAINSLKGIAIDKCYHFDGKDYKEVKLS